jgi:ABC-2 type transport system ATP-binding protein
MTQPAKEASSSMAVTARPATSSEARREKPGSEPSSVESGWSPSAAVEVRDAGKRFGANWVVRKLNFTAERGAILGLLGPSGSGKTTTIRLMLGLVGLDEGEIRVLGTDPRRFRAPTRACIGYMPQLFVLYPELSVSENLSLAASLYGMGWLKRRKPMRRVLEFVELWDERGKVANDLSGGMKRRLQLAAALVHDPELIVVDEPTAGVDPILRAKFWDHFRELRHQGRTIVVTSQYVTEAEYCDRVAMLGRGELAAIGTPEGLRQQAFGGEMVDVLADGIDRQLAGDLAGVQDVKNVRALSYDRLRLTVESASVAIPRILAIVERNGAKVRQIEEYRPNFDEVFVQLMEQSHAEHVE